MLKELSEHTFLLIPKLKPRFHIGFLKFLLLLIILLKKHNKKKKEENSVLTIGESALINHRAPGAGQLVDVKANGELVLGVWLQVSHQETLFIPVKERQFTDLKGS